MDSTIIVAIISLVGTLGGSFIGVLASNKLTNYKIDQLEKTVQKHNGLIERVYGLEKAKAVIDEEIETVEKRITRLEHYHE